MYASHLDSHIYKYYAEELLNPKYNKWCIKNNINDNVTAYRNNKPHQSNVNFASEVINEIVKYKETYIMVGDFEQFFDKLNHYILKKNLKEVLGLNILPKDWYNIFRSVTKFGYFEKEKLVEQFGTDKEIKQRGKRSYFKTVKHFRDFQKNNKFHYNRDKFGIPQGTPISAVLANVYAIHFDLALNEIANQYDGMYRRYSDDFILILPKQKLNDSKFSKIKDFVFEEAINNKIYIQRDKTEILLFDGISIKDFTNSLPSRLDYLGFVFDGKKVVMRHKSVSKFYRKAYRLIEQAQQVKEKKNLSKLPYRKMIYGYFTDLGPKVSKKSLNRHRGNFISYAKRAQKIFDEVSPYTDNQMMLQINRRKENIENKLGYRIHSIL